MALDSTQAVVRINATGHVIKFEHDGHNAVPQHLRIIGAQGVILFPKAPPFFTDIPERIPQEVA